MRILLASMLSACGFGGAAAGPDALVDASSGTATIAITERGQPLPSVAVYFQGSGSDLLAAVATDEQGRAGALVPPGSFVTVVVGTELVTFADVQPGDALRLEREPLGPIEVANVTVAAEASLATAATLYTTCGGPFMLDPQAPTPVQLLGCGGTANALVATVDADTGSLQQWIYDAEVHVEDGQPTTVRGQPQPAGATTIEYTNVPAPWQSIEAYRGLVGPRGVVFEQTSAVARPATAIAFQSPTAPGTAALVVTTGTVASTESGQQSIYDYVAGGGTVLATTLDLAPGYLRRYLEPAHFADHRLSWSEEPIGQEAQLVRIGLTITRPTTPEPVSWRWRLVGRHGQASVTFPALPDAIATFDPRPEDIIAVGELTSIWFQHEELLERYRVHALDPLRTAGIVPVETSTRIVEQYLAPAPGS